MVQWQTATLNETSHPTDYYFGIRDCCLKCAIEPQLNFWALRLNLMSEITGKIWWGCNSQWFLSALVLIKGPWGPLLHLTVFSKTLHKGLYYTEDLLSRSRNVCDIALLYNIKYNSCFWIECAGKYFPATNIQCAKIARLGFGCSRLCSSNVKWLIGRGLLGGLIGKNPLGKLQS